MFVKKSNKSSIRSLSRKFVISRIITKTGRLNTFLSKLPNKHFVVFVRDWGNTLLTIRWRWILLTVCLVNFISFFLFGFLWMLLASISGDFEENVTDYCVVNTRNFTGYVLLSIETIMTIGYGYRYPTEKCVQGWVLVALQSFVNTAIQGALVSAVYVKIAKPFTKDPLSIFSKKAVICLRDGKLCFVVRIIDLDGKVSVGTNITMYYVDKDASDDPETDPFYIQQINVEPYGFLMFPLEIVHVIDNESPLWKITPYQLLTKRMEIIVVMEGSSMVTGQLSQIRTSYTNSEILWGHRFSPCLEFNEAKVKYVVHYKDVNTTIQFDTPLCSAQELDMIKRTIMPSD